jgi:phage gpG-like protein
MAKQSSRFLKGKKVKNVGATVIKRMIKSINALENQEGRIKGGLKIKSAADFTSLKTLTSKFREECNQAHIDTLQDLVPEIEAALTNAMNTKAYDWEYGDGDIVQTGELRDSVDVVADAESIIVTYSAKNSDGTDYAAIVYWGGYAPYGNPNVKVYMPARPWIKHVLVGGYPGVQKFPLTERYLFHFEKNLRFLLPDVI